METRNKGNNKLVPGKSKLVAASQEMKWLISGASGQLGRCLQQVLNSKGIEHIALTKNELNVSNRKETINMLKDIRANVVVNAAAYTNVENAENEVIIAYDVNQVGAANIAVASKSIGAKLVHFSTDYVFSGIKTSPWEPDDLTEPLSVYGKSKLAGEIEIADEYPGNSLIIRTSWLYSSYGKNFYKSILDKAINTKDSVRVVCDQIGQPTSALDLAELTVRAVECNVAPGIFHATNAGSTSWYEFAQLIFELAGEDVSRVSPVSTLEFPSKAARPKYSVLSNEKWKDSGVSPLRSWEESVTVMFPVISKSLIK
jgi:dTDP-4-dehydrorhamnose reductase